ncbi:hypothetical protein [Streptomyces sp. NPDC060205]|uniref:hypothetical protein n=1 Tax=Streptomyces sp. NPDC060205 TaxID=3347072 RepID=UPI003666894A
MRFALIQVGFQVLDETDVDVRGLRVTEVSESAVVSWMTSGQFTSLVRDQADCAPGDAGVRVLVKAAVSGLLAGRGHHVADTHGDGDVVVLADAARRVGTF